VQILCEHGADMGVRNFDGKTAFNKISNNLLMVKLLKKYERA